MLASLAVMGFFEMTLHRMSLATLVIALGLLVDNGIVIAEDFKRRPEDGASRDDALQQTGGQMAFPLLSSTLTTILVFLPLMLAEHVAGEYTRAISLVILITLLTSWVLAMCLTPLLQVADFARVQRFGAIAREDLARTVTVEARNTRLSAEDMLPLVQPDLDRLGATLAPGHHIEIDGVVEQSAEGQAALSANFPLCVGAMLMLLVIQFNGYRRPAIIVATLPLLVVGAVIGIYATRADFGFMVILGLYALAGILINNAIVLIDQIDIDRARSDNAFDAVIAACVRRLHPIVMTTVTTILGLLPLILFHDALFYGMASVIAFGLAVGTVLTLGVVPVLYCLVFRVRAHTP